MDVSEILRNSTLFTELSSRSIRALAEICVIKRVSKRQVLFLEGEEGRSIYLVLEGRIQLHRVSADGREIVIKVLGPGELFAEVVLFEQDTYPVSAAALTAAALVVVSRMEFRCLLENGSFRDDFIAVLMRKQRYLTERIYALTGTDVESRFFGFLEEQFGRKERYRITLPKRDISAAIGANPETLSRLIQRLTKRGLIRWAGAELEVSGEAWQALDG